MLYECVEKEKFAFDKVDTSLAMSMDAESRYDREVCLSTVKKILKK